MYGAISEKVHKWLLYQQSNYMVKTYCWPL